jgi:hypothetical protein
MMMLSASHGTDGFWSRKSLEEGPPKGLKANIGRSFIVMDESTLEGCAQPTEFKNLLLHRGHSGAAQVRRDRLEHRVPVDDLRPHLPRIVRLHAPSQLRFDDLPELPALAQAF